MKIEMVPTYMVHTQSGQVSVKCYNLLHIEGCIAYVRLCANDGQHVQGIKFLRAQLGLRLREAKAIYDEVRYEAE